MVATSENLKKIIRKVVAFFIFTAFFSFISYAQPTMFFNNGAEVYVASSTILHINGGFQNDNIFATANVFENDGAITIATSNGIAGSVFLTNNSTLQGDGNYFVEQDWINDAVFIAGNSSVDFNGDLQENITSSNATVTTFNNLVLSGTGTGNNRKKTLLLVDANIDVNGTLVLNNRELETLTNTIFVLNPSINCISNNTTPGNEGFVSSSFAAGGSGYLSRVTNSASAYLFPTGSSNSTTRYRPVKLTPSAASANTYTARLGNNDPTLDNFNILSIDTTLCQVNQLFYHEVKRSSGSDNSNIDLFYDQTADGAWDGMAKWNSTIPGIWNNMAAVTATAGNPLNDILKVNWADFSNSPYILSRQKPAAPSLMCSPICANSTNNIFTATGTTPFFLWSSPLGTTITSGQNTNTVSIDWGAVPGTVAVSAISNLGCASSLATCMVGLLQSPVAEFSSNMLESHYFNFTDLSVGATMQWAWDFGDGKSSAIQNPNNIYLSCGYQNICLTVSNNICFDSACSKIWVNELAIIPNVFTPNGDDINDEFFINSNCIDNFMLEIYNRWGMKIFETNLTGRAWDGFTASGEAAVSGTYFFIFKGISNISGKDFSTNGFVTLIRD